MIRTFLLPKSGVENQGTYHKFPPKKQTEYSRTVGVSTSCKDLNYLAITYHSASQTPRNLI